MTKKHAVKLCHHYRVTDVIKNVSPMRTVTKNRTLYKCHTRKTLYKCLVCSINLGFWSELRIANTWPLTEQAFLRMQYHSQCWQVSSNPKLIFSLALWVSLPAATCWCSPHADQPLGTPGAGWRASSRRTRQRGGSMKPRSVTSFHLQLWFAVILSWSNLYPTQVAWEEEATAARSFPRPPA